MSSCSDESFIEFTASSPGESPVVINCDRAKKISFERGNDDDDDVDSDDESDESDDDDDEEEWDEVDQSDPDVEQFSEGMPVSCPRSTLLRDII